ncbi:MAG: hypothetical protein ACI4Q6_03450 [Huintestinicola sp.]
MAEESGFLKTVNFGGFDKKDVLSYVDKLNTKIYTLENELNEKNALLENSGGNVEEKEKYEKLLAADKAKITELQAGNDSLKMQLTTLQEETAGKDKEIAELKKKLDEMETELVEAKNKAAAAANAENTNAMDFGNVFLEAQRTASSLVTQAKENARKMDEDAKKLANQVVDDANSKASTIVKSADEKAARILNDAEGKSTKILSDAETKSADMRTAADNMKAVVLEEITEIMANVTKIKATLEAVSKDSLEKVTETVELLGKTEDTLKKDGIPQFTMPKSMQNKAPAPAPRASAPAPAPAPAPKAAAPAPAPKPAAPAPAPAPKPAAPAPAPAPKPKPVFDMSDIEKLTKEIENVASKNKDYDGNVDPKSIKLSDMR